MGDAFGLEQLVPKPRSPPAQQGDNHQTTLDSTWECQHCRHLTALSVNHYAKSICVLCDPIHRAGWPALAGRVVLRKLPIKACRNKRSFEVGILDITTPDSLQTGSHADGERGAFQCDCATVLANRPPLIG